MPKRMIFLGCLLLYSWLLKAQLLPTAIKYTDTSTSIYQSFNNLPSTGSTTLTGKGPFSLEQPPLSLTNLTGWFIRQIGGSQSNTNFSTSTGSSTGSGVYSFGLSGNNNRAIGTLASGTGIYAFGLILKNETGLILNRLTIQFLATQWRKGGSGNINTWKFGIINADSLKLNPDSIHFQPSLNLSSIHTSTGSATLNGQLPINQTIIKDTITDIQWLPGQCLLLQWSDSDETGSDDAMAIDDFSFKASQELGPPTITAITADSITSHSVILQAIVDDQLSATTVELAIDTITSLSTASYYQYLIPPGTGPGYIHIPISTLLPKTEYYFQFKVLNQSGSVQSSIDSFKTTVDLPIVTTDSIAYLNEQTCIVFGNIVHDGGSTITASGFCWGLDSNITGKTCASFNGPTQLLSDTLRNLPTGTRLYFQAYGRNEAGFAYGNNLSWFSPTIIHSFEKIGNAITNQDTIYYRIIFKDSVSGISEADFNLLVDSTNDASIIGITKDFNAWIVGIRTGSIDGPVTPVFLRNHHYQPGVFNAPFTANTTLVDKTKPRIRSIEYNNKPYKAGDTIHVTITVDPESQLLELIDGHLAGYPFQQFTKFSDSCWKTFCVIKLTSSNNEINAAENLSVLLVLRDQAGNYNSDTIHTINYDKDAIDFSKPQVTQIILPEKPMLKSGDSLFLRLLFSEAIKIDSSLGSPSLSVTVGTRIRNPFLYQSLPKSLVFCYIIQPDELDLDGIRISNTITLNNAVVSDLAGNLLVNQIPNAGIFSKTRVDAVPPVVSNVVTPAAKTYGEGDTILFAVFCSKPLIIPESIPGFGIEISVASSIHRAVYITRTQNPLQFYWIVPNGISDKKGISISTLLKNSNGITDSSGNDLYPILKNIDSMSNITVDGITPQFKDSLGIIQVCSKGTTPISEILQIIQAEAGETIEYDIVSPPIKGKISGFPVSSKWLTSNNNTPFIAYSSSPDFSGYDECIIRVSDGVNACTKKVTLQVNSPIIENKIQSNQLICTGFSALPLVGNIEGGNKQYQFKWESTDADPNSQFKTAIGQSDQANYLPLNLQQSTRYRRIAFSGGCVDSSAEVLIKVRSKGLWLGNISDSWHQGGNWCGANVPDRFTDVYIPEATSHSKVKIIDSAFAKSVYAEKNAQLQIYGSLSFSDSISGSDYLDATGGTIIASSKEIQQLNSSPFRYKTIGQLIAFGTQLDITDTIHIDRSFSVQKGILNTQNKLFLNNSAFNAPNAPGTKLKGDIIYKHQLNGKQFEQFLFHPFIYDLPVLVTEKTIPSIEKTQVIFSSNALSYDKINTLKNAEYNTDGLPSFTWKKVLPDTSSTVLLWEKGKGIILSLPGEHSNNTDSLSLLLKGGAAIGDVVVDYQDAVDSNYLFTGNPLLSDINSKHVLKSDGIGHYYWTWDTNMGEKGGFRAKAFASNNRLKKMEGYIVKILPEKPINLTYPEQSKLVYALPDSVEGIIENTFQMEILLMNDQTIYDQVLILDVDSARTRYDAADAEKIANPVTNLYTMSGDSIPLCIDARWMTNRTYIPLCIHSTEKKQFSLKFSRVWLKPGIHLELHDHYTGKKQRISENLTYHFEISADTASFGRNRFVIRSPIPPEPLEEPLQLQLYPVPSYNMLTLVFQGRKKALTTILLKDLHGNIIISRALGEQQNFTQQLSLSGMLNGTYLVEVHSGKLVIAKTFIKL